MYQTVSFAAYLKELFVHSRDNVQYALRIRHEAVTIAARFKAWKLIALKM